MTVKVTQDDLLSALAAYFATPVGAEGSTVAEMSVATGQSPDMVRKALHALAAAGRLEVMRVMRPSLDGGRSSVPAYRLKP